MPKVYAPMQPWNSGSLPAYAEIGQVTPVCDTTTPAARDRRLAPRYHSRSKTSRNARARERLTGICSLLLRVTT
jgi:hypothetical protein